ncbi:MAG: hypothetical protein WEC59_10130, partial [Salibacteraceae bacterium]
MSVMNTQAQVQPQFKFYLAFEDAKHEKDTVWFGVDESAASQGLDSIFGDTLIPYDTNIFNVSFGFADTLCRKTVINGTDQNSWGRYIYSINHQLPITIRWDTNLLKNHTLPFELKQATLYNNNYLTLNKTVDLFKSDSVMLPEFTVGGGAGNHFPLMLFLSKNDPPDDVGIKNTISDAFSVYPKPASTILNV